MDPIISFRDFTFQYRAQARPTLYNIDLDIYPGEKILIAGPSGSGKSTLASCINGLIPFSYPGESTGTLTVDGMEAKKESIFALSKSVGTVLQDPDGQFIGPHGVAASVGCYAVGLVICYIMGFIVTNAMVSVEDVANA